MDKGHVYYEPDPTEPSEGVVRAVAPHRLSRHDVMPGWECLEIEWHAASVLLEGSPGQWYIDLSGKQPRLAEREHEVVYSYTEPNRLVRGPVENAAVRFTLDQQELVAELDSAYDPAMISSSYLIVAAHAEADSRVPMGFSTIPVERFIENRRQSLGIKPTGPFWLLVRGPYRTYSLEI